MDGEPRIAREEIAKHVGKITLKPMFRMYIATGVWDWLGLGTRLMVVAGPNRLAYMSAAFRKGGAYQVIRFWPPAPPSTAVPSTPSQSQTPVAMYMRTSVSA